MNMSVTSALFDLDGTLVDPAGAITSGIRHALVAHGLADPGEAQVEALVGPPLQVGLRTISGVTDENIEKIIATYRTRYEEVGMDESKVYPGIIELLQALRRANVYVAVTTAKPVNIARMLLDRKGLTEHLDAIHGNEGEHGAMGSSKAHIVAAALKDADLDASSSVVIGDRYYDVDAARENSVKSIGVSWGFAQGDELSHADLLVDSTTELAVALLGEKAAEIFETEASVVQKGAE